MNTRYRAAAARRPAATARPNQAPAHGKFRIVIVETTTNNEVQLCSVCTHRVNELQHEDAAFALKSEYEDLKNEGMEEEYNEEELVDVNAIDEHESATDTPTTTTISKKRANSSAKSRGKRRFGYDQMIKNNSSADMKYPTQPKKVIFPESEYDVLEKKLIELESKLTGAEGDEFKKLCKTGVLCEERWAQLYCRDYNKPLEEYRNEAISVLKHNLDIRRGEGVRPVHKPNGEVAARQPRRDPMSVNPSVSIATGGRMLVNQNAPPARDFYRGSPKRTFGTCIPIATLTTGPLNNYSLIPQDPCFMIENILFDVESRLKRCEPNSKEYEELVAEGRKLREEWRQAREEMMHGKPVIDSIGDDITKHPSYDIQKCIVLGRTRRQRANDDFVDIE